MADRIEQVYDKVRQELMEAGEKGSKELYEMAKTLDKAIGRLSIQQFHARYVLPVKREQAKARGGSSKPRRRSRSATTKASPSSRRRRRSRSEIANSERDEVRGVLLQFAQDFSGAETKSDVVRLMSRVDEYVDQITKSFA